jgi:hypothetical protein
MGAERKIVLWSVGITFLVIVMEVIWFTASDVVANRWPEWSWRNGSSSMQRTAAVQLVKSVSRDVSVDDVILRLGPGSKGWPTRFQAPRGDPGEIAFNIRSGDNWGICVKYEKGRVQSAEIYD